MQPVFSGSWKQEFLKDPCLAVLTNRHFVIFVLLLTVDRGGLGFSGGLTTVDEDVDDTGPDGGRPVAVEGRDDDDVEVGPVTVVGLPAVTPPVGRDAPPPAAAARVAAARRELVAFDPAAEILVAVAAGRRDVAVDVDDETPRFSEKLPL